MKRPDYWTSLDKKIVSGFWVNFKRSAGTTAVALREAFRFSYSEMILLAVMVAGVGIRLCGIFSSSALPEEILYLKQSTQLLTAASSYKFGGDSFYGVWLCLPSLATMVWGMAAHFTPPYLFLTYEGSVTWLFPYLILAGRLFGVFIFPVTAFLLYVAVKRFFSVRAGLTAAALLALSPLAAQISRFSVPQNGVLLVSVLWLFALLLWWKEKKNATAFFAGGMWGFLTALSPHALYLTPFFLLFVAVVSWRHGLLALLGCVVFAAAAQCYNGFDIPLWLDNVARQILLRRGEPLHLLGEDWALFLIPGIFIAAALAGRRLEKAGTPVFVGVLIAVAAAHIPFLFPMLNKSPLFAERLQPLEQSVSDFNPGPWKLERNFQFKPPLDFGKQAVLEAYWPNWNPVSLARENRGASFFAREKKLREVKFVMENKGDRPGTIEIELQNKERKVLASSSAVIGPRSGWCDVSFPMEIPLQTGGRYFLVLKKTGEDVRLLESEKRNVYMESAAISVDGVSDYHKTGEAETDYLMRVEYVSKS